MKRRVWALCGLVLLLFPAGAAADEKAEEKKESGADHLDSFAQPLVLEAAPFSHFNMSALPATWVWGTVGALYGRHEVGRADYEQVSGEAAAGFMWSPRKLDRFALGGKFAFLQVNSMHTRVPPVIDEWDTYVDMSELNVFLQYNALRKSFEKLSTILLTPFVRFHLPTDTSRLRPSRHIPIKKILGPEVGVAPYVLVEPGVAFAATLGPATFYASSGLGLGSIVDEGFLLLWNLSVGAAVKVPLVHLVVETGGYLVHQKNHDLFAWQVSPGIRFVHKHMRYELGARIGLGDSSTHSYGLVTAGFAVHWIQ
jgi:hypothetical protein